MNQIVTKQIDHNESIIKGDEQKVMNSAFITTLRRFMGLEEYQTRFGATMDRNLLEPKAK